MNKKFKLFSTIASLCLAVALMAFGVYAATHIEFSVNTQVSFEATKHVQATVKIYETAALAAAPQAGDYKQVGDTYSSTRSTDGTQDTDSITGTKTLSKIQLTESAWIYSYKVEIKNDDAEHDLPVALTKATPTGTGYTVEVSELSAAVATANGGTVSYTVTITITNPKAGKDVTVEDPDLATTVVLGVKAAG